jgi:hypothetical protein
MSTMTRHDRPGLLERLTNSTAFTVLFGIAATILAPVVLLGLTLLPAVVMGRPNPELGDKLALLLPYGGAIGYVGLWRAYRPSTSKADYRATLACLAVGIVTAASLMVGLIAIGSGVDLFSAGAIVVLSLPIVAALGQIARLRRLRAGDERRVRDSLPLIFLALAFAEAACAIAIGVQLAIVG